MKTDLFLSGGHCWVFQICWHIECSTFTASSFRIWNSSVGIPSPPLALFIVMHSKALKSGRLIPPVPFFFLKIALAIQGFLYFHTNCEIMCSSSVKNVSGRLIFYDLAGCIHNFIFCCLLVQSFHNLCFLSSLYLNLDYLIIFHIVFFPLLVWKVLIFLKVLDLKVYTSFIVITKYFVVLPV